MSLDRPAPRPRGHSPLAVLGAALAFWIAGGGDLAAQSPPNRRIPTVDSVYTRVTHISPRIGPAGTEVTVQPTFLPALTPVQISLGGTRSGFEVLTQTMTDATGELSETLTVKIPPWVERDRTYLFIVVDMYFRPLAVSDIFHATDADGTVERAGRITGEGAECRTLRGTDGELYSLHGEGTGELRQGDDVVVVGAITATSACGQGTALRVQEVRHGS